MLYKTRSIVLHTIHYGDASLIVHLYTEKYGRQVFFMKGAKNRNTRFRPSLFFPLNLLELEAYHRESVSMQKIKEAINKPVYQTIHNHPIKSAIAIFIAEVLYRVLHAEHDNKKLFDFLYQSFIFFDNQNEKIADFHLVFLTQLLLFEGFFPINNFSEKNNCFKIQMGRFVPEDEAIEQDMVGEQAALFSLLLKTNYDDIQNLKITTHLRRELLNKLLEYYHFHLPLMGKIKSVSVLNEIFH